MADGPGRRMFHEDIFAEDNDKFSWQPLGRVAHSVTNEANYNVHAGRGKDSSNSPSSEEDSLYKVDSNSLKRSFKKQGSCSTSEGNAAEDMSLSPRLGKSTLPPERVLPSIYDDDARSGSPSGVFEKKDLAFQSSFKRDFHDLKNKGFQNSSLYTELDAGHSTVDDKYAKEPRNSSSSYCDTKKESKESRETRHRPDSRSRSSSKEKGSGGHNRSRDKTSDRHSKSHRSQSPVRRSRSKDSRRRSSSPEIHKKSLSPVTRRKMRSPELRKKTRSPDSRKKSPSPSRRRKSRSPNSRRRSNSRGSRRRSRSRDSRRRSHSRGSRRRSHSRNMRRRSRSRSYDRHRRRGRRSSSRDRYRRRRYSRSSSRSRGSSRKPGSLPLSTSGGAMTPQMALQQTMAAMSAKAQAMTGIALPKYYNPAAVNPLKYAEQVQKRKLLWQTKETVAEQPKNTVWDKLTFDQDQDGRMTAKFRKLMGIKSDGTMDAAEAEKESVLQKQAVLFRDLDQQYEMARVTTHTQRGVGLGYSATTLYPPVQK